MNKYTPGETVRVRGTFRNELGALADPAGLTVRYRFVDDNGSTVGSETLLTYGIDAAVVRDSAGRFHVDIPTTLAVADTEGLCRFASSSFATAKERRFKVLPSEFDSSGP